MTIPSFSALKKPSAGKKNDGQRLATVIPPTLKAEVNENEVQVLARMAAFLADRETRERMFAPKGSLPAYDSSRKPVIAAPHAVENVSTETNAFTPSTF